MRSFSLFTIVLLCCAILIVDIIAFYELQSITDLIPYPKFKTAIQSAFWIFTFGLIFSILWLKLKLDQINPIRRQVLISSLYGLSVSSFIPKLIFILIIIIMKVSNDAFSEEASVVVVPFVALFSGFLPFFVIVYGIFKTVYKFKIHRVKLCFKTFPKSYSGLRIVQISDIHIGSFNFRYHILNRAVKLINKLEPDILVLTGDLVNNYAWELRGWDNVFKQLKSKIGKYAVLGNHDYGDYSQWEAEAAKQDNFEAIKAFYKNTGFRLLCNEAAVIGDTHNEIAIIGVENWGKPPFKQYGNLKLAMKGISKSSFKILLSHDPSHWKEEVLYNTDINLTLSGHTHGMQAGIKLGQKNWSPIQYKFKEWAGLYSKKEQYLYVNRGLGWLGFPGRIGMRPEITLIELEPINN